MFFLKDTTPSSSEWHDLVALKSHVALTEHGWALRASATNFTERTIALFGDIYFTVLRFTIFQKNIVSFKKNYISRIFKQTVIEWTIVQIHRVCFTHEKVSSQVFKLVASKDISLYFFIVSFGSCFLGCQKKWKYANSQNSGNLHAKFQRHGIMELTKVRNTYR